MDGCCWLAVPWRPVEGMLQGCRGKSGVEPQRWCAQGQVSPLGLMRIVWQEGKFDDFLPFNSTLIGGCAKESPFLEMDTENGK